MFQLDAVTGAQSERVVVGVVKEHHACCLLVDGHGLRRRQDSLISFISTVSLDKTHQRNVMPDHAENQSIMILNHWLVYGSSVQDNHA